MSQAMTGVRTWTVAAVGASCCVAALLFLFRAPDAMLPKALPHQSIASAKVELASSGDAVLKEEAGLRDPTPLFLPTIWNAADDALAMNAPREPGGSFQNYPAKLTFPEAELKIELPAVVAVPARPGDAFAIDKPDRPFAGFGEKDSKVIPLPLRGGYIEVTGAGDGEVKLTQALTEDRPTTGEGTWQPLEFVVAVDAVGIVRPPVLIESSRVPAVDSFFQEYLVKVLHIGERLGPGFYRVSIGP